MKYIFPLPEWFMSNHHTTVVMVESAIGSRGYGYYRAKKKGGPLDYLNHIGDLHGWFGFRVCIDCNEKQGMEAFTNSKGNTGKVCSSCTNKRDWKARSQKLKANPELRKSESQRRRKYPSYRDPDYYKKNKEHQRMTVRKWKHSNPDKVASYRGSRHRKMDCIDNKDLLEKISKRKCYWCGCRLSGSFHLDHVIPISKGGKNIVANLVASCQTCNLSKGAKMPNDFIKEGQLILEMT